MNEWCPECMSEEWEVLDYSEDFEIGSVTLWWKCRCPKCHHKFEIVREYNLDPAYSYTRIIDDEQ